MHAVYPLRRCLDALCIAPLCIALVLLVAGCSGLLAGKSRLPEPSTAAFEPIRSERPVIALALGSGGSRGFAHVGVIKALEEAGIKPDIVVGSSSGAIVAALYAGGFSAQRLEAIAAEVDESDLIDLSVFDGFRILGERLARFVGDTLDHRPIEALPRALAVVATDAETGNMTVFNRGDPGLAVRASASVPRLFVPATIRGRQYIDGGLVSPVPVKLARAMGADIVIAVDVSRLGAVARATPAAGTQSPAPTWSRTSRRALLEAELTMATVVVRPALERTALLDFDRKLQHLTAGEDATRQVLPELNRAIAEVKKPPVELSSTQ
jgi:NTE family protein